MKVFLFAAALALVSACTGAGETTDMGDTAGTAPAGSYERIAFEGKQATADEQARCEAAGGDVQQAGLLGNEICVQTLPDAGETCSDSTDCLGRCLIQGDSVEPGMTATGQCTANDNPFGCFQAVRDGVADGMLCVD